MADRVGEQFGSYRLVRLLGQGGFAEVYLGQHIYLDTPAAIKVLHHRLASDDIDSFLNEARTIARLIHPQIVRVLEFNVQDNVPYLVVDYAPNGTLRKKYTRGTQLPVATVVSYVRQIASALQYAHEQKIIDRYASIQAFASALEQAYLQTVQTSSLPGNLPTIKLPMTGEAGDVSGQESVPLPVSAEQSSPVPPVASLSPATTTLLKLLRRHPVEPTA